MKNKAPDISGKRFGWLTVIERAGSNTQDGQRCWRCHCGCGAKAVVSEPNLISGTTKSCGCKRLLALGRLRPRHVLTSATLNDFDEEIRW